MPQEKFEYGDLVSVPSRFVQGGREVGRVIDSQTRPDGVIEYHVYLGNGQNTTAIEKDTEHA